MSMGPGMESNSMRGCLSVGHSLARVRHVEDCAAVLRGRGWRPLAPVLLIIDADKAGAPVRTEVMFCAAAVGDVVIAAQ